MSTPQPSPALQAALDSSDPASALKDLIHQEAGPNDDSLLRDKEQAILNLATTYRDQQNVEALSSVIRDSRPLVQHLAKAKTAKLIRTLLSLFSSIPNSLPAQITATEESITWATSEQRLFLAQNLQVRLVGLFIDTQQYPSALSLISSLLRALKKLDDKLLLTEVHLLEARVNYCLANMPKAKAALTSARTAANSIYCPPTLQAELDGMSGILHAEEKDYKTAYSYFFESFEGLSNLDAGGVSASAVANEGGVDAEKVVRSLKYMLLCKIMLGLADDVPPLLTSKTASRYTSLPNAEGGGTRPNEDLEAMKLVAKAHKERDLKEFEKVLGERKKELSDDPIIRSHLASLYDTLLEQNLVRLIEPYSRVEIDEVARLVGQPRRDVENKLSQMILDKVFHGILDQGAGCLIVFDEPEVDKTYTTTLETISQVSQVVDQLFQRTRTAVI
ncbi:hypothetical protein JCM11641_004699 [Rhodosporidiobolus odoratus]